MRERLRIFVSSPGDVKSAREIAALTIERLAQDYARLLSIEPYLWEFEAMVASGHFQDSIEPPSAFDVVVLILWSRLGTHLPERTTIREYRGIDGRTPLTGTEWEFEEAMQAAKQSGAPDLLVYRNRNPAPFDTQDSSRFDQQSQQLKALNAFWERNFANQGVFIGAYTLFSSDADFAKAIENHLRKLIEKRIAALQLGTGDKTPKAWMQAPFRGLEAYEFEHAPIFFGQDEALARAMLQLTANAEVGSAFLLVLGASGSGKSSLVKAGIIPKLFVPRRIAGIVFLRRVIFRPSDAHEGEDLFDALARRLVTQVTEQEGLSELIGPGQSVASLAIHLRNAAAAPAYPIETALAQLASIARQSGHILDYETAKLVLVVDQLEELFTVDRTSASERVRFIELLAGLVRSRQVWVIATMRRDFWHRAEETPELVRLSEGNGRLELLPPLPSQLSQMIRRPAEAAGIQFEIHGTTNVPLNEVISEEVALEPGAMPLLSYLLDQLYRIDVLDAHGSALTYATYERLGRLEGAIATQAEAVLDRCLPEDRDALGSVLFSLVDMGISEGNVERAVARRVPLSTFQPGTPQRRLVEALLDADARLLVSGTEKGGSPTVRVAHEALITRWAQAREFVRSNSEALKIRHRIEERYAMWRELQQGDHEVTHDDIATSKAGSARFESWRARFGHERGLLTDIDLMDGRRLLEEYRMDNEPHLVEYIDRSVADNKQLRMRTVRALSAIAILVTGLAIVASVAGWVASKRQHEAEYQAMQARRAQVRAETEAHTSRATVEFLSTIFDSPTPENSLGRLITARELLDAGAARLNASLVSAPEIKARLSERIGNAYRQLGEYDRAAPLVESAVTQFGEIGDLLPEDRAEAYTDAARFYYATDRHDRAREMIVNAARWEDDVPIDRRSAEPYIFRAEIETADANFKASQVALERAGAILAARRGADTKENYELLLQYSRYYFEQGKFDDGERFALEAVEAQRRILGESDPTAIAVNLNIQLLYLHMGAPERGEPYGRRARDIAKAIFGDRHPSYAGAIMEYADTLGAMGRPKDAEQLMREALDIRLKTLGPNHTSTGYSYYNLGNAIADQGRNAEALPLIVRSQQIWEISEGKEHPDIAWALDMEARLLTALGRSVEALPLALRARAISERAYGPLHPNVGRSWMRLGDAHLQLGEYRQSIDEYEHALHIFETAYGPNGPRVGEVLKKYSRALGRDGRGREASAAYARANHIDRTQVPSH